MLIKNRIFISVLFLLFILLCLSGCSRQQEERERQKLREKISQNVKPFRADYFKDTERRHVAVFYLAQKFGKTLNG